MLIMEFAFKQKFIDKLLPFKFKVNYWLLRKLGLWGYGIFAFLWGAILTVIVYEYLLKG